MEKEEISAEERLMEFRLDWWRTFAPEAKKSEPEERSWLIQQMLDKIMPIPTDASEDVRSSIDDERQTLVLRAGWHSMSIYELRQVAAGHR